MGMTTQRSLWPLVAVLLAGLPLGLLAYALAIRRSQSAGIAPTDRVLQRFDEANSPAAIESPVQSSPVAHRVEPVAPPLEGAEPVHVPDHAAIVADEARAARERAEEILSRPKTKPTLPRKTPPVAPAAPPKPEPISIRPPAPEDAAARVARETLSRACAALRRTRPDWKVKSYDAKWQATLIEANGKTAHVAFGGGKWPDCDVRLEFDQLRQKWKVRAVERGGFPPGLQW